MFGWFPQELVSNQEKKVENNSPENNSPVKNYGYLDSKMIQDFSPERAHEKSLVIAVPCGGGTVSDKTATSLFKLGKLLVRNGISHALLTQANSSLISLGRSRIANFFVNSTEHQHLLFLDNDISFEPEDVIKMLDYDVDIVSGAYPMKTIPVKYCVQPVIPEEKNGELIKICKNGMGFVLIKRRVFEKMAKDYPELKYIPTDNDTNMLPSKEEVENSYHFFAEVKTKESAYLSEDNSFFARAMQSGIDIWLDPSIFLEHVGSHVFSPEYSSMSNTNRIKY